MKVSKETIERALRATEPRIREAMEHARQFGHAQFILGVGRPEVKVDYDALIGKVKDDDVTDLNPIERQIVAAALVVARQVMGQGPFICGHSGGTDGNGLHDYYLVCPQYGADGYALYKKHSDYDAPGW